MKNKKTCMLSVRILEEEKEKLQDEANARGILLSEVVKEMIIERINDSSYDKNLMAEKKDIELPKEPCPFCGIVVDWGFVKINKLSSSADAKYCPNPDCRKLVYAHNEENGWRKRESETNEEKEFDDLLETSILLEEKEKNRELKKRESKKKEIEKRESQERESKKKKKKKEKVYGDIFGGILTFDNEEESEEK